MSEAPRLSRLPREECPETWIRIPSRRRPSWDKIDDLVVPLERKNLYGHPLASLLPPASQMAAVRFLDTNFKLPGTAGEAQDAVSAHTQVHMSEAPRLLRLPEKECRHIWIRRPPNRRPTSWDAIEVRVVPLEPNLHGHPLADCFGEEDWNK